MNIEIIAEESDRTLIEEVENRIAGWGEHFTIAEYQEAVENLVEDLISIPHSQIPEHTVRKEIVETITECHFTHIGKFPKNSVLTKLGDFLLLDYIKDLSKSKFDENVFHSEHQVKRRMTKEFTTQSDTMDFLNSKMNLKLDSLHKKTVKQVD